MATVSNAAVAELRARFELATDLTVGIEEELMLLDAGSLDLAPRASELLRRLDRRRFTGELPAAQIEIVGPPSETVGEAAAALRADRRTLEVEAARSGLAVAGCGVHPFTQVEGRLSEAPRYEHTRSEYGAVARLQLVFGLHVHVAVPGADRALAVYNALREELPALAALGADAPFLGGRDTGLASVRPKLCDLLPRQGVPPALPSWEALADAFAWGRRGGTFHDPAQWWWDARLHPVFGTIEVRVCDAQATVDDVAALAAVVQTLAAALAERYDAGETLGAAPAWRIAENRWSACRHGVEGWWVDVRTGRREPMRDHIAALLDELEPLARGLGCAAELDGARRLLAHPPAASAREAAAGDPRALVAWLADRFTG